MQAIRQNQIRVADISCPQSIGAFVLSAIALAYPTRQPTPLCCFSADLLVTETLTKLVFAVLNQLVRTIAVLVGKDEQIIQEVGKLFTDMIFLL